MKTSTSFQCIPITPLDGLKVNKQELAKRNHDNFTRAINYQVWYSVPTQTGRYTPYHTVPTKNQSGSGQIFRKWSELDQTNRFGMVLARTTRYRMIRSGLAWFFLMLLCEIFLIFLLSVWYGMVWTDMVRYDTISASNRHDFRYRVREPCYQAL